MTAIPGNDSSQWAALGGTAAWPSAARPGPLPRSPGNLRAYERRAAGFRGGAATHLVTVEKAR